MIGRVARGRSGQRWRLSRKASRGDTFGHRIERIRTAAGLSDPRLIPEFLGAIAVEPDPAVRKLLALGALCVARRSDTVLDDAVGEELRSLLAWKLPR